MNWVDGVVIAIFVVSALLAFARGFVREVMGIAAWVGAGAVAWWAGPLVLEKFQQWIDDPNLAYAAAYASVFIGALILFSVVAGMIGGLVRVSLLSGLDRTLGLAFGIVRGAAIVVAAYIGLGLVLPHPDRWPEPVQQARSTPYIYQGAEWAAKFLPERVRPNVYPPPAQPAPPETSAEDLLQPHT